VDDRALWQLRFREARDDPVALRELADLLKECPDYGAIRLKVAQRIVELRKHAEASAPLTRLLAEYGLGAPDGRWLYQYRLSDENFDALQSKVRELAAGQQLDSGFGAAQFVLWAAEWFRRHHPGGLRKWEDLEKVLGFRRAQPHWRETTDRGLRQMGRKTIKSSNFRYFLSTLAREGGFPAAALRTDERSWATNIMSALVATLLADDKPTERRALELANTLRARMPIVFSDDDFVQLCADLALAIVGIRRNADAEALAAGIPVAAWLDAKKPNWKRDLPISLDGGGVGLIDQLMTVRPQRLASGYVDASRYLALIDGVWTEAAVLELNGDLGRSVQRRLSGTVGRMSVFASGKLARYLPGELAYLDADSGDELWMHSLERRSEMHPVPFACAIEMEIRSPDRLEAKLRLPGGDPVRGRMTVMTVERERDGNAVELLLRGVASGKYRHDVLVVQIPTSWQIRPTAADELVAEFGTGPGGGLWRVEGGAIVITDQGDCYRLLCGQSADCVDRLEIVGGQMPAFIRAEDSAVALVKAPIEVRLLSGNREVREDGRICIRAVGTRDWARVDGALPTGYYELAWKEGDIVRDSQAVAVLPESASIARWGSGQTARYELTGWRGCALLPDEDAPVRVTSQGGRLAATSQSAVRRTFTARVQWDSGSRECPVLVDFPCGAGIARWDGALIGSSDRISLADLDQLAAYSEGRMEIHGRLLDGSNRVIPGTEMRWPFEDEMALSVIANDLRRAMSPAGIDAKTQLGMHDGFEIYWTVAQFTCALRRESGGLVSPVGVADEGVALCARALAAYTQETTVDLYSLAEVRNHRPVRLPTSIKGPALAYLRKGDEVITRPIFEKQDSVASVACDSLARAMASLDPESEVCSFLDVAAGDSDVWKSRVDCLVRLVVSLRGLPPATFRALELAAKSPRVLARMLATAVVEDRLSVLDLEMALPFAWFTIKRDVWNGVMGEAFDLAKARLTQQGVTDQANEYAIAMVSSLRDDLRDRHPILCELIFPRPNPPNLAEASQLFLNRNVDRVTPVRGSIFRDELGDLLPSMFLNLPDHCLEYLDAPCAAAIAARGGWAPSGQHTARMKLVARLFPSFFRDAFAASLVQ
jgi:hypothetical protein